MPLYRNTNNNSNVDIYMRQVAQLEKLDKDLEIKLIKKAQDGDIDALNRVYSSNLQLVLKLAGSYRNSQLDYLDFVQEGNMGLRKAILKYKIETNNKFSTYAARVIQTSFKEAIEKYGRTIRLPVNILRHLSKVNKYKSAFVQEWGFEPTDDLLIEYSEGQISEEDLFYTGLYGKTCLSLDATYGEGDDASPLYNFVEDKNALIYEAE